MFSVRIVARIQKRYGLMPRYDRLRKAGMLTVKEMAVLLGITPQWVKIWNRHGLLRSHACSDRNDYLYEHPDDNPPRKAQGVKLSQRCRVKHSPLAKGRLVKRLVARELKLSFVSDAEQRLWRTVNTN